MMYQQILRHIFFKGINILGSTQGTRAELEQGFYWMSQGKIKAIIDSVYTFENAVDAHNKMLNGKGLVGKIISQARLTSRNKNTSNSMDCSTASCNITSRNKNTSNSIIIYGF